MDGHAYKITLRAPDETIEAWDDTSPARRMQIEPEGVYVAFTDGSTTMYPMHRVVAIMCRPR